MSLVIFAFGLGGVFLIGRRLDEQPELMSATSRPPSATAGIDCARVLVGSEF